MITSILVACSPRGKRIGGVVCMRAEGFLTEQYSSLARTVIFFNKFDMAQFKHTVIVEFCFGTKRWLNQADFGNQNNKVM
jgi:hypothetical protein